MQRVPSNTQGNTKLRQVKHLVLIRRLGRAAMVAGLNRIEVINTGQASDCPLMSTVRRSAGSSPLPFWQLFYATKVNKAFARAKLQCDWPSGTVFNADLFITLSQNNSIYGVLMGAGGRKDRPLHRWKCRFDPCQA